MRKTIAASTTAPVRYGFALNQGLGAAMPGTASFTASAGR